MTQSWSASTVVSIQTRQSLLITLSAYNLSQLYIGNIKVNVLTTPIAFSQVLNNNTNLQHKTFQI